MSRIRALIFDFDGLILDTESPEFQSWQEVYREYGGELPLQTWARLLGTSANGFDLHAHLEEQVGRPIDRKAVEARRYARHMALVVAQPILPGVEDTITSARRLGLSLAVASTSSCNWVEGHLMRLGLIRHFDVIRCGDHVQSVKPAPDLYLAALDALGVQAGEAIAFEDSPNGVTAAKRAGIFCVAVPNEISAQLDLGHADLHLDTLADMPLEELLAEIHVINK